MDVATAPPEAPVETRPLEPRPKTPREVGEHAARYIEEHGWTQGTYNDDDGRVCMHGAIAEITGRNSGPLYGRVACALSDALGTFRTIEWNDAPERTEAEVLAALRSIR